MLRALKDLFCAPAQPDPLKLRESVREQEKQQERDYVAQARDELDARVRRIVHQRRIRTREGHSQ